MEELDDILETAVDNGRVDLSHRGYNEIDTGIFAMGTNILVLNLSFNTIKVISSQISELPFLTEVMLVSNYYAFCIS